MFIERKWEMPRGHVSLIPRLITDRKSSSGTNWFNEDSLGTWLSVYAFAYLSRPRGSRRKINPDRRLVELTSAARYLHWD